MNATKTLKLIRWGDSPPFTIFAAVLLCLSLYPYDTLLAQGYIGIRATPNLTAVPKVFNNSPAAISTGTTTALEAGLDYTFMLNRKWGISVGTDFGTSNWSYNLKAPLAAFGNPGAGEASVSRFHNYLYNSAALSAVYKIPAKESDIRIFAGPTFRVHHSQRTGSSRRGPDNRSNMYSDASAGTPDLLVEYPSEDFRLITIMSAGIGYEHNVSDKLDVLLGLRANFGLQTMTKGIININMNNQLYRGSINTNSNYVGFDVAFRFKTVSKGSKRKS